MRPKNFVPHPFDYHEMVELEIDSLTNLGVGVGRSNENWVVFVPFSLPQETVSARVFRNHANYSEADLIDIINPSPNRIEPQCQLFAECGGCQYQHLDYPTQLDWKRRQVVELLEKMAGVDFPVDEVVGSPIQYGYRSKITPHFKKPKNGVIDAIGFLRHGRRQQLVDVVQCPIASPSINTKLPEVRASVRQNARGYKKGATLLLRDSLNGHVCTDSTETCEEKVGDLTFSFHAGEFFQNNPHILPVFVQHVTDEALGQGKTEYLVDCYCGSGLFCLSSAHAFTEATGIEISQSSIDWAKRNAETNRIENCRFVSGDAAKIFENITYPSDRTSVIIDPPRKGSTPEFLDQLIAFGPCRVIYVSCNPATQIRDLQALTPLYQITRITPFDLFPQTRHLECIVTLQRS